MDLSSVITGILVLFMAVGAADRVIFQNRLGYGEQFEEGIRACGQLILSMAGIMCMAPVLGRLLEPVVAPVYHLLGADPAMISGTVLAMDMGGYPLAKALTQDSQIWQLSGIYTGSMLGATISFSIPVSLGIICKEDREALAKGILSGIIAAPAGAGTAALTAGMEAGAVARNLFPALILAVILAVGLMKVPQVMLKGFQVFAVGITACAYVFLTAAAVESMTGFCLIPGMDPLEDQLSTIGMIAVTLAGAYPFFRFITKTLDGPLERIGKLLRINRTAVAGMASCLANNIPMFGMIKDMDEDGKVVAVAFSVCASFALGDHLGYVTAVDKAAAVPMIAGKLAGGLAGAAVAKCLILRNKK